MSSSDFSNRADDDIVVVPLESVIAPSIPVNNQSTEGNSQRVSQQVDDVKDGYGAPNELTEALYGSPNTTAPRSFWVNDAPYSSPFNRRQQEADRKRSQRLIPAQEELERHRRVLKRVRAWHSWDENRHSSLGKFILSKIGHPRRPSLPTESELLSLALYYYPPRVQLRVVVCDFGEGRFHRFEENLSKIESLWAAKPRWAADRWIHIAVGPGLLASSLEDLFMYEKPGKPNETQSPGTHEIRFPHCEVLNVRDRQYLQDQVDVYNILRNLPFLSQELDLVNWRGDRNDHLLMDVQWRANHRGTSCGFWELSRSDLPSQLTEGIKADSDIPAMRQLPAIDDQMLSQHEMMSKAVLVIDPFRSTNRGDGFFLTMSPTSGINRLDKNFTQALNAPPVPQLQDRKFHMLERLWFDWSCWKMERASNAGCTGDKSWNAECLLVKIIGELLQSTTLMGGGPAFSDIQSIYIPVVRDLKRRRASQFKRYESVKLVRDYVTCMNEISELHEMSERNLAILEDLRDQWNLFEKQHIESEVFSPEKAGGVSSSIDGAKESIKKSHNKLPRLLNDLKSSLDVLFQLRTIEQNELAIIAESNNKAILVFTVVTIIFLPLSFFTSYFGMNLQGVVNTDRTERYFWAVCGSVTIFVVSMTVLFGFKNRLHAWVWDDREFAKRRARSTRL